VRIRSAKEILKEIFEEYNKETRGWYFSIYLDEAGRLNVYVINILKETLWRILLEPHGGVGTRIGVNNATQYVLRRYEFGFRKIPQELLERIKKEMRIYGRVRRSTIEVVKECNPVRTTENPSVVGPYIVSPFVRPPITTLDERITRELKKELWKKAAYLV